MDDHAVPQEIRDIDPLRRLCTRIRLGDPPGSLEIERELETGFGRLIALEAELARARARGSQDGPEDVANLTRRITALRDLLMELRTLSTSEEPPRIGYGFVLPGRRVAAARLPRSSRN